MHQKIFWKAEVFPAIKQTFVKLNPFLLRKNIIMFVVELCAIFTTVTAVVNCFFHEPCWMDMQVSAWLWITILFSNFAESLAESKGRRQSATLRKNRSEVYAQRLVVGTEDEVELIPALMLEIGDVVIISEGMIVPSDGDIVEGVALIDESTITGESAPVVRESGGDKVAVTGGTKILTGKIKITVKANAGETFLDQMIDMIESTKRQKTPNETALEIFLLGLTIVCVVVVLTLPVFGKFLNIQMSAVTLAALLVCLIPTSIGGLLPAIGIAGMDRLLKKNVIALTGRAIEAAGDVNVVLLDKTGTITLGNRLATEFITAPGIKAEELARFAMLASLADDTPEGRSIVILAKEKLRIRGRDIRPPVGSQFVEFRAETQMSGINISDRQIRKGSLEAIEGFLRMRKVDFPADVRKLVERVAHEGGTPLIVADQSIVYGAVYLKDILKDGMRERLLQLKKMGITSVLITGDNPLTAAAIAVEAGVGDVIAQATPAVKVEVIKKYQQEGYMVAMIGDGTNDAPALAQADVAVAMNIGTQEAREAANMVDLDSAPTKLLDIIEIGKQILITRGAITTFSITNDVAKYFAIIPSLFMGNIQKLNIMRLASANSAIMSAIIFNAIVIPLLIPMVLHGVQYKQVEPTSLLRKNLLIYGLGGLVLPFIGIKLIDLIIVWLGLA